MMRYLVILCFFVYASAHFFDEKSPIMYGLPGETRPDYFGYSVALSGGRNPWIQIGAPRGVDNGLQSGVVYRCGISESCRRLVLVDTTRLNGSFIGNSMDVSPSNDIYAVCGHRWTIVDGPTNPKDYYTHGACFYGRTNETSTEVHDPFKLASQDTINVPQAGRSATTIYNYGQGQAGFSAQFMNDQSGDLIVGAPGTYNWAGLVLLLKARSANVSPPAARRSRSKRDLSDRLLPSGGSAQQPYFNYFGYSVSSGRYFSNDLLIAAGVPRNAMIGKVALFGFAGNEISLDRKLDGHQFGEYFGGAVASADVNNDGKVDLIIGAPTYKRDKYDEGRVYVYVSDDDKNTGKPSAIINGESAGGRFGEAIAALGDIDYDGFEDVAIAAPNENDGHGAVYIHRGSADGLRTLHAQKLEGKSFGNSIRGFGYSMSRATDIDGNHCKDLAVGAFQSGHAFVFRSRPVITLRHTLTPSVDQIPRDQKSFTFKSCISYNMRCKDCRISTTIVEATITIDSILKRASIDNPIRSITLGNSEICEDYNVKLSSDITNLEQPLKIWANLKLQTQASDQINPVAVSIVDNGVNGRDDFCKDCPVLDADVASDFDYSIPFFLGCGQENKCRSNLKLDASFANLQEKDNVFVLGSQKHLTLLTVVENDGDKAYSTKLTVNFPRNMSLRSVPSFCKENNDTSVTCNVDNPLENRAKKSVELDFDMDNINNGLATLLNFDMKIETSSENLNKVDTSSISLQVIKRADIILTGKSKDQYYYYENTSSVVEFGQVLQVQKEGPSTINDVVVDISIPTALGNEKFLVVSDEVKSRCREISSSQSKQRRSADDSADSQLPGNRTYTINCLDGTPFTCSRFMCNTGRLSLNVHEFQLKFTFNVSKIADALGENDNIIFSTESYATIEDSDITERSTYTRYRTSVTSILLGQPMDRPIAYWIIIAAVVGGLLLLCIIVTLLYKFGFFERKTKMMLEEEKLADNEHYAENTPLNTEGESSHTQQ